MIKCQRDLFAIPENITYLNSASYSPLIKQAYYEGIRGLNRKLAPWNANPNNYPIEAEEVRGLFASLIGATSNEISIINSTSYGMAIAARNLTLKRKQKIIVLEDQFPSNILCWQQLATEKQGKVIFVNRPSNYDWTSAVIEVLDKNVSIVSLPPCHWFDGSWIDLERIGRRCRELGAALVVDATQAIGAMPFDVNKVKPDFLTCSAYKWLLCPYSLAFLYTAPHQKKGIPLEFHRWNHAKPMSDMINLNYHKDFNIGARRYDMGEVNNFVSLPIAISSLTQIRNWTPKLIKQYLDTLILEVSRGAKKRGWKIPSKKFRVSHFVGIIPPKKLPKNIASFLKDKNVFISQRGEGIRISPHIFNNLRDIRCFFEALDEVLDTKY